MASRSRMRASTRIPLPASLPTLVLLPLVALSACEDSSEPPDAKPPPLPGPAWTRDLQVFVYGRPPLSYLESVAATGVAWSVYHGGVNEAELEYTRAVQARGVRVASNLPTMQGSSGVLGDDPAAADPGFLRRTASEDLEGNAATALWIQPDPPFLPSHNDPEWQDFLERRAGEQVRGEVDAIHLDEIEGLGGHLYRFGFDPDSLDAFSRYLAERFSPAGLADRFGIADVASFDYGAYLRAAGASALSEDPRPELRREFVRFQLASRQEQLRDLVAHARGATDRPLAFAGNAVNLGPQYQVQAAVLDFLVFENATPLPPDGRFFALHRLGYRLMRGAVTAMFPNILDLAGLARTGRDWPVIAVRFAEAWAAQQSFLIPHEAYVFGGGTATVEGSATVPAEVIAPVTALARAHAALRDARLQARVALVYSLAAALEDYLEGGYAASYTTTGHHRAFLALGERLERDHVLFDVVYAGDDELVPRRLQDADLAGWDVLVLPPDTLLADADRAALDDFRRGGGLVTSDPSELDRSRHAVSGDLPETVSVTVLRPRSDALAIHLVNHDYDRDAGAFVAVPPARMGVPLPGPSLPSDRATLKTPGDEPLPLAVEVTEGVLRVELPAFSTWGLLLCGDVSASAP